ncbi:MAG TPA: 4'-phosphopantetheinyl transferase superfamily protein [Ktedonobacteraceae bacterium]
MATHPFLPPPPEGRPVWDAEVHVWLAELEQPARTVQQLASVLSEDESLRARRFYFERDRRRFIVARGVLRRILGWYLDLPPALLQFTYGPRGKPSLLAASGGERLRFNVSHSHELALYAVTRDRELGVDIEFMRPLDDAENIARHFFSASEQATLRSLPASLKHQAFYNCWTRKEAYIKATGEGLSQPLDEFDVSLAPGEPAKLLSVVGKPDEVRRWSFEALQPPAGYAAALAVEGAGWNIACWRWAEPPATQ